ncbi:MAG: DMT family transporter [Bacteroidetes bacterium]|nr:DMT family transporter [Bacteroidota bacterium]
MGIFLALITTLCWSLGIFPFTEAAKRFGTAALNQYRLLLAWIFISIIACCYYWISPYALAVNPTFHNYFYLGLSGVIGFTIGDFCSFNSFKILGPKLGSLYTTIAPCSTLILGSLILKEEINFVGIMGMGITLSGVVWLTLSKKDAEDSVSKGFSRNKSGIFYGITGALCQGCGLVLTKLGFQKTTELIEIPTLQAVWIRLLFAFVGAMLISLFSKSFIKSSKIIFSNQNKGFKYMLAGTILGPVLGVSLSLVAITYLKVAEAQTIFALIPVFVLPLNYYFYKEKITVAAFFACVLAVSGVFVLIWSNTIVLWI